MTTFEKPTITWLLKKGQDELIVPYQRFVAELMGRDVPPPGFGNGFWGFSGETPKEVRSEWLPPGFDKGNEGAGEKS